MAQITACHDPRLTGIEGPRRVLARSAFAAQPHLQACGSDV
jgi:hypothetical protein